MKTLSLGFLLLISSNAFAADLIEDTTDAIEAAIGEFRDTAEVADVQDFQGISTTPDSGGVKVMISLKSRSAWSFQCHRHHANDPMECHEL